MKKKRVEYIDERKDVAMEGWIGRHWKQVLFFSLGLVFITVTWAMYNVQGLKKAVSLQAKAIENLSKRVIIAAPDGRVVILQTSDVADSYIVMILRDIINKYLIMSSFEINNIAGKDPKKFAERIKDFPALYCEGSQCLKKYEAYANTVWSAYRDGILPEVIYITGITGDREVFKAEKGKFYYHVVVPIVAYSVREGKWVRGEGQVEFSFQGEVKLMQGVDKNPWGIKFSDFTGSLPVVK